MGNGVSNTWKDQGNAAYAAADYVTAIDCYTQAIAAAPDDPRLYSNRSAAALAGGLLRLALEDAQKAANIAPVWSKSYYRLGKVYAALNRPVDAVDAFTRAVALEPDAPTLVADLNDAKAKVSVHSGGRGSLYTWGRGEGGVLGHASDRSLPAPKVVDALRGVQIMDVSAGMLHTVAITAGGDVYAWGLNKLQQCGMESSGTEVKTPMLVPKLIGLKATAVACGGAHTLVAVATGEVYSWGAGGQGQLGHGDSEGRAVPTRIEALVKSGCQIASVASGMGHCVVVDGATGHTFAWGWNHMGQLGLGHTNNILRPTLVKYGEDTAPQHVSCGAAHTCVVSRAGKLYTAGGNACGQLGLGHFEDTATFTLVEALAGSQVALAACGEEFSVAVTHQHQVYTWGLGNAGQLGTGNGDNVASPVLIESLNDCQVELITAGQRQVIAITADGRVFVWGQSEESISTEQAGLAAVPEAAPILRKQRVMRLESGRNFYCAVTRCTWAANCVALSVPEFATVGQRVQFKIQAKDTMGMAVTEGGDRFQVTVWRDVDDAALEAVDIEDCMSGQYVVTFRARTSGHHRVDVTLGGQHIAGSPFHVLAGGGEPHAAACSLLVLDAEGHVSEAANGGWSVQAGSKSTFVVQLRDVMGNQVLPQADADMVNRIGGAISGASVPTISAAVVEGTAYHFHVIWRVAGRHDVRWTIDGTNLPDSPLVFQVTPGPIVPSACMIHLPPTSEFERLQGLSEPLSLTAGTPALIHVTGFDKFGNRSGDGLDVTARIEGAGGGSVVQSSPTPHTRALTILFTNAGQYRINIWREDVALGVGFAAAVVSAAAPDPLFSQLERVAHVDDPAPAHDAPWCIQLRGNKPASRQAVVHGLDEWGNPTRLSPASLSASLGSVVGKTVTPVANANVVCADETITFTVPELGQYQLVVSLNGAPLLESPVPIHAVVHPDEVARRAAEQRAAEEAAAARRREEEALEALIRQQAEERARIEAARKAADEARRQQEAARAAEQAAAEAAALRSLEERRAREAAAAAAEAQRKAEMQAKLADEAKAAVIAKLRAEEATRRRAEEALAKAQREAALERERERQRAAVKRTGGGFIVQFDPEAAT